MSAENLAVGKKPPRVLSRRPSDGWVAGVCAGLARDRPVSLGWVRAAFVAATLVGGLGVVAYLACWLIIPGEGEEEPTGGVSWIVRLAQACAACAALAALGAAGATATVFGFGWAVAALTAAVLISVLVLWPRRGPAWALLPIAVLTLPSLAVAADGLHLQPELSHLTVAPRALSARAVDTVQAGLGTTLIDLRRTALPNSGVVALTVEGGVRRTIIALPSDRCVHVTLEYHAKPFVDQVAAQLTGALAVTGAKLFGRAIDGGRWTTSSFGSASGPWLRVDFTSLGGSLYIRDYPTSVDPEFDPDWPGYPVFPEARPDIRGVPRRAAARLIAHWQIRHAAQVRSQSLIDALTPGPCVRGGAVG